MLLTERQRLVIRCDRCPVRLDLGPDHLAPHLKLPSGWFRLDSVRHMCPLCSAPEIVSLAKRLAA